MSQASGAASPLNGVPHRLEHFQVPPDPAGTLEGLRNAGYTVATAVADLIDNSLASGAEHIDVQLFQDSGERWFLEIKDDGRGMPRDRLIEAMRISAQPAASRQESDLGRYGIGMKAAALHLSASGEMEIDTRTESGDGGRTGWSLAGVRQQGWTISVAPSNRKTGGTTIRIPDPLIAQADPSRELALLWQHLSLVFAVQVSQNLQLTVQGKRVQPVDVLGENLDGTRHLGPWLLDDGRVNVKGYILPATDPEGAVPPWMPARHSLSGLHVRRGGRAITFGGWAGLERRGQPTNDRVRLLVSIRPEDGDRWGVDLTKSRMTIPPDLLPRMRDITSEVVNKAQRMRALRSDAGSVQPKPSPEGGSVWTAAGQIDRQHPAVARALLEGGEAVKELLRELEREGR